MNKVGSRTIYGHGGDQNGFLSYIDFDPKKRTASIIVVNTTVVLPENAPADPDVMGKLRRAIRKLHEAS
jgi:hypothetical protein